MNYMKLVTAGVKHHLCVADQPASESMTLCGCLLTRAHSLKRIRGLEGDECENCAKLAFGGSADRSRRSESRAASPDV
jgi:hypothetical protein